MAADSSSQTDGLIREAARGDHAARQRLISRHR
jgi:hypothetical protein